MTDHPSVRPGQVLSGSLFSEPMRVVTVDEGGPGAWVVGAVGTQSERFRSVTLGPADLESLTILEPTATYVPCSRTP